MKFEKQWNAVLGFFSRIGKRNALIALAVILIGCAIVLNVVLLSRSSEDGYGKYDDNAGASGQVQGNGVSDYFAASVVSRERTRDEAMQVLQSVVDDANANESTKAQALLELTALANAMESESKIETLVISKGFEQCVAVINGEKINVIVKCDGLNAGQIAQINEIVYEQAGILPRNINIIEKNA